MKRVCGLKVRFIRKDSVTELISGNTIQNVNVSANMVRSKFYVCPICGNASAEWYDCVNGEKTDKDYHSAIWIPVKKND